MRAIAMLCSALIGPFLLAGQQERNLDACSPGAKDAYYITFVRSAMQFFNTSVKSSEFSSEEKKFTHLSPSLPQLGDAVSVAALKIYELDELTRTDNANAYLTVVRIAFSDPSRILQKSDQDPRVTELVLRYLEKKEISDTTTEKRIIYIRQCIAGHTCSPQSEFHFFESQ